MWARPARARPGGGAAVGGRPAGPNGNGGGRSGGLELHWKILIGLLLGIAVGLVLNVVEDRVWSAVGVGDPEAYVEGRAFEAPTDVDPDESDPSDPDGVDPEGVAPEEAVPGVDPNADAMWLAAVLRFFVNLNDFVGQFFLRGLLFIAAPIVLASLIVGASSLTDMAKLGRLGGKTVGIYLCTTAVSITIGLLLANTIRPGLVVPAETRDRLQSEHAARAAEEIEDAVSPGVWDVLLNMIPENPFEALAEGNMLQIVVLALAVGVALARLPAPVREPVVRFFNGINEVLIRIVHALMQVAPYAVFALLVPVIATLGLDTVAALVLYCVTLIAGLAIMVFMVYPTLLKVFAWRMRYTGFFAGIAPAQLLAFSSSSSAATLPVTMDCCENRLGVSEQVTSFVCPLGATINMDGTAMYQGVAAVFIAQLYGLDLTLTQQLTIVLTATLASIGTAGVPGVGTIMLVIVLESVGIPLEGIAVILGVDRLLDMCRTTCNITGDAAVACVVASTEGELNPPARVAR